MHRHQQLALIFTSLGNSPFPVYICVYVIYLNEA